MSIFSFKLQPVLNYKSQIENMKKNDFGKAIKELEVEKQKLSKLENVKEKYIQDIGNESQGNLDISKMKEYNSFLSHMRSKIAIQSESVQEAETEVDNRREVLVHSMKERQILDKLREKHFSRFIIEENLKEQQKTDEAASYKHKISSTGE